MPISDYLRGLRAKVGTDLLLMPAASIIVRDEEGCVLLAHHTSPPGWALPGGSIDPGEIPADAAVREMWEETGLLVKPVRVFGVYGGPVFCVTYPNGDQICSVDIVFECKVIGGALQPDQDEVELLAFFSQEAIQELPLPPWTRVVLADLFAEQESLLRTHIQPSTWQPPSDGVRHHGISDYVRDLRAKIGNDLLMMPAVGALVYDEQGQLLVMQRGDNQRWDIPVGGMDPHETPIDAAVREVWEETGLLVEPLQLLLVRGGPTMRRTFANGDQTAGVFLCFVCRVKGGTLQPDGVEAIDAMFLPVAVAAAKLPSLWSENAQLLVNPLPVAAFQPATWQPVA